MAATPSSPLRISLSAQTLFAALLVVGLVFVGMAILDILVLIFISCVLAAALFPGVTWLKRRNVSRPMSILLFYLLFLLLAGGLGFLLFNVVLEQGQQLIDNLPGYTESLETSINSLPGLRTRVDLSVTLTNHIEEVANQAFRLLFSTLNYLKLVVSSVVSLVTVLVLTFFLLSDTHYFQQVVTHLFPESKRTQVMGLLSQTACNIGAYVRGQLTVMAIVGILTWLGLSLVGIRYAFLLGVLAFLLDIIPIVGPFLAAGFGILVAIGSGLEAVLWTGFVYLAVQQIENYFLSPTILGKSVDLHPFWILLSFLIGGSLMGVTGVILAVPVTLTLRILLQQLILPRIYEIDRPATPPAAETL
jgi:predicted PurR-regulated permease PerM